ncbi:MAG: hypothetical protein J5542_05285, partial [Bacteroidales bacterium]|nr:hypothetical protein [Bacteroidales bacterium]
SWTFFRLKLSLKLLLCLSSTVNFSIVDLFYFTVLVNKNGQPISGIDIVNRQPLARRSQSKITFRFHPAL